MRQTEAWPRTLQSKVYLCLGLLRDLGLLCHSLVLLCRGCGLLCGGVRLRGRRLGLNLREEGKFGQVS